MAEQASVFEYMYRDGGNFKTCGSIRLVGWAPQAEAMIRQCLELDSQFVAEQVGVPALCEAHWRSVDDGPSDLDHAYHEFLCLRPLQQADANLSAWGSLNALLARFRQAARRWDVRLSPNCDL